MSSARHIVFVTGTRADFGKLEPLASKAREGGFRTTFFVTGMHMLSKYGLTKNEVARNGGFDLVEFVNHREGDPQDVILAKTVTGFSDYLKEAAPDLVVIHGDRVEALACSLVCAMNYVRCAHVEGGEVSGTIDEVFRHCSTKLCHLHLVSSEEARDRVIRMGERPEDAHVIGSPELDIHGAPSGVSLEDVLQRYEIASRDFGICIFHPVTSEQDTMGEQARAFLGALEESGRYFVVILPNNDPGSDAICAAINALPQDRFRVLPSMRFAYFSELMRNARAMVGNSSTGVREAPFLGIPSLDIGTRQSNRASGPSIFTAEAADRDAILSFLDNQWGERFSPNPLFGKGSAAQQFLELLNAPEIWSQPLQKSFNDGPAD